MRTVNYDLDEFRAAQEDEFALEERKAEAIDRLRRPSFRDFTRMEPVTDKQTMLIERLLEELKEINVEVYDIAHDWYRAEIAAGRMNKDRASEVVTRLKKHCGYKEEGWARRADFVRPVSTPVEPFEDIPDGYYALRDPDGHVRFFRVSTYRGKRKVQSQASDTLFPINFTSGHTILRQIRETGMRDSAFLYGREIGRCCRCGHTLTDEDSRAAGIGPYCASKTW